MIRFSEQTQIVADEAIRFHKLNYEGEALDVAYRKLSEELGELLAAMGHHSRGRCQPGDVLEEIGDIMLLLGLVIDMFQGEDRVNQVVQEKAKRFMNRMKQWKTLYKNHKPKEPG